MKPNRAAEFRTGSHRVYDRRSGTGRPPTENKKKGAGGHNWGWPGLEMEEAFATPDELREIELVANPTAPDADELPPPEEDYEEGEEEEYEEEGDTTESGWQEGGTAASVEGRAGNAEELQKVQEQAQEEGGKTAKGGGLGATAETSHPEDIGKLRSGKKERQGKAGSKKEGGGKRTTGRAQKEEAGKTAEVAKEVTAPGYSGQLEMELTEQEREDELERGRMDSEGPHQAPIFHGASRAEGGNPSGSEAHKILQSGVDKVTEQLKTHLDLAAKNKTAASSSTLASGGGTSSSTSS